MYSLSSIELCQRKARARYQECSPRACFNFTNVTFADSFSLTQNLISQCSILCVTQPKHSYTNSSHNNHVLTNKVESWTEQWECAATHALPKTTWQRCQISSSVPSLILFLRTSLYYTTNKLLFLYNSIVKF